jgi:hypothetical protein
VSSIDEQIERRMGIMDFLSHSYADIDGIVIGVGMLIEFVGKNGERGIHKITSDAGGHPLPWYANEGFAVAMSTLDECDDTGPEEDE